MSVEQEKTTNKDILYSLAKGGVGSIPIIGALATEIFSLVVTPPMEKRRAEWMNDIAERLKALEDAGAIDLNELTNSDQFIDVVLQATTYALKTSEEEKIRAFRNGLLNTALGDGPSKVKSHIFLTQLDKFTSWHIKLLGFIDDPREWLQNAGITIPNYMGTSIFTIICHAFPELKEHSELVDVIWDDLKVAGFHNTTGIRTTMTGEGALAPRTTPLGQEFLRFISGE